MFIRVRLQSRMGRGRGWDNAPKSAQQGPQPASWQLWRGANSPSVAPWKERPTAPKNPPKKYVFPTYNGAPANAPFSNPAVIPKPISVQETGHLVTDMQSALNFARKTEARVARLHTAYSQAQEQWEAFETKAKANFQTERRRAPGLVAIPEVDGSVSALFAGWADEDTRTMDGVLQRALGAVIPPSTPQRVTGVPPMTELQGHLSLLRFLVKPPNTLGSEIANRLHHSAGPATWENRCDRLVILTIQSYHGHMNCLPNSSPQPLALAMYMCPRIEGFLSVIQFPSVIRALQDGYAAVVADLTRVGGKYFPVILPKRMSYDVLHEYLRPMTSALHDEVVLDDGEVITMLAAGTPPPSNSRATDLFVADVPWFRLDKNRILTCAFPIEDLDVQGLLALNPNSYTHMCPHIMFPALLPMLALLFPGTLDEPDGDPEPAAQVAYLQPPAGPPPAVPVHDDSVESWPPPWETHGDTVAEFYDVTLPSEHSWNEGANSRANSRGTATQGTAWSPIDGHPAPQVMPAPEDGGSEGAAAPAPHVDDVAESEPRIPLFALVYVPDILPELHTVHLHVPCSRSQALTGLLSGRSGDSAMYFPAVIPVVPQPDPAFMIFVAKPGWFCSKPVVLFDCRRIDQTMFAQAVFPELNRESILLAAGRRSAIPNTILILDCRYLLRAFMWQIVQGAVFLLRDGIVLTVAYIENLLPSDTSPAPIDPPDDELFRSSGSDDHPRCWQTQADPTFVTRQSLADMWRTVFPHDALLEGMRQPPGQPRRYVILFSLPARPTGMQLEALTCDSVELPIQDTPAVFAIMTPGYTFECIELDIHEGQTVPSLLEAVDPVRDPGRRSLFPVLLPVNPQADARWGSLIALPAWAVNSVIVCFDMYALEGRIFAARVPPLTDRYWLLRLAGISPHAAVEITCPCLDGFVEDGHEVRLAPDDCVTFVAPTTDNEPIVHLAEMLGTHLGWASGPPFPGQASDDRLCIVSDDRIIDFVVEPVRSMYYKADIAFNLGLRSWLLHLTPAQPAVRDSAVFGRPQRTVLTAGEHFRRGGATELVVGILDGRPLLQSWQRLYIQDGWLDLNRLRQPDRYCTSGLACLPARLSGPLAVALVSARLALCYPTIVKVGTFGHCLLRPYGKKAAQPSLMRELSSKFSPSTFLKNQLMTAPILLPSASRHNCQCPAINSRRYSFSGAAHSLLKFAPALSTFRYGADRGHASAQSVPPDTPYFLGEVLDDALTSELLALCWALSWAAQHSLRYEAPLHFLYDAQSAGYGTFGKARPARGSRPSHYAPLAQFAVALRQYLNARRAITHAHVKGHTGQLGNELCDALAKLARRDSATAFDRCLPDWPSRWAAHPLAEWAWATVPGQCDVPRLFCFDVEVDLAQHKPLPTVAPPQEAVINSAGPAGEVHFAFSCVSLNVLTLRDRPAAPGQETTVGMRVLGRKDVLKASLQSVQPLFVGLQETRLPQSESQPDSDYLIFTAAATEQGTGGCSLWIAKDIPLFSCGGVPTFIRQSDVTVTATSPRHLVALIQTARLQLQVLVLHAPSAATMPATTVRDFWDARATDIVQRPEGSDFLVLCDANSRLGDVVSELVSDHGAEAENIAGGLFHEFLAKVDALAPSTWSQWHSGSHATWVSFTGLQSRIDYILVPREWKVAALQSCVLPRVEHLQLRDDHFPVHLLCQFARQLPKLVHQNVKKQVVRPGPAAAGPAACALLNSTVPVQAWDVPIDEHYGVLAQAWRTVGRSLEPDATPVPRQPYLSAATLEIVKARQDSRVRLKFLCRERAYRWKLISFAAFVNHAGHLSFSHARTAVADRWLRDLDGEEARMLAHHVRLGRDIRRSVAFDRTHYLDGLASEVAQGNIGDAKALYRVLRRAFPAARSARRQGITPLPMLMLEDGTVAQTTSARAEAWRTHFSAQEAGIAVSGPEYAEAFAHCTIIQARSLDVSLVPTLATVEKHILATKSARAAGPDGITAELLRLDAPITARQLLPVFLKASLHVQEPITFRGGDLVCLAKRAGQALTCEAYRSILVSSVPGKQNHRGLRESLKHLLLGSQPPFQAGVAAGQGIEGIALAVRTFYTLCRAKNVPASLVFFDLQAAFYQ
ncbi:tyrP-A, partial [Symbiodinium necroappetens]